MNWTLLVTLVSGVLVGFIPNYLVERRKERHTLSTRWDVSFHELSVQFITATQRFQEVVQQNRDATDAAARTAAIDSAREDINALMVRMRLVGSERVQRAARIVIRHAWAVRQVSAGKPDPRADEYPGTTPRGRLNDALHEFIRASRVQLRVEDPEDIAAEEPEDWPELGAGRSAMRLLTPWR